MARLAAASIVVALLAFVPSAAHAQASITGIVKDTSGAVMPGVTVEASSPALIEKTRTAVTDSTGQYRIVDLRAGTYAVGFNLTGFNSVKREGIELTGSFTATVNVEMKIGAIEETITIVDEAPIVDVQSARRQQTMSGDVIATIPAARGYNALVVLVPGVPVAAPG